jgi:hypothetical protein
LPVTLTLLVALTLPVALNVSRLGARLVRLGRLGVGRDARRFGVCRDASGRATGSTPATTALALTLSGLARRAGFLGRRSSSFLGFTLAVGRGVGDASRATVTSAVRHRCTVGAGGAVLRGLDGRNQLALAHPPHAGNAE